MRFKKGLGFNLWEQKVLSINSICCIKISPKWRMKTQLIVSSSVLFILTFITCLGFFLICLKIFDEFFYNSEAELFNTFVVNVLQITNIKVATFFFRLLNVMYEDLQVFQKLHLVQSYPGMIDAPYLLTNRSEFFMKESDVYQYSWVCYSAFKPKYNSSISNIKSVDRMNQIFPLTQSSENYNLSNFLYGVFKEKDQFFFSIPCTLEFDLTYHPHTRPWYKLMVDIDQNYRKEGKVFNSFAFTQPYLDFTLKTTTLTMIKSIFDKNYNFQGVFASDFQLQNLYKTLNFDPINVQLILTDPEGLVLLHNQDWDTKTDSVYFYHTEVTGFTKQTWKDMLNFKHVQQNCSMNLNNIAICRWNYKMNLSLMIHSIMLKKIKYYAILYTKELVFFEDIRKEINQLDVKLIQILLLNSVLQVFTFVCSLSLMIIVTYCIFRPMLSLHKFLRQFLKAHKFNQKLTRQSKPYQIIWGNGVFYDLTLAIERILNFMSDLRSEENLYCTQIQNIKYPRRNKLFVLRAKLDELRNLDRQLTDQSHSIYQQSSERYQLISFTSPRERILSIIQENKSKPIEKIEVSRLISLLKTLLQINKLKK